MANIQYILLSCVLALLVIKINGSNNISLMKGSTAGREISLERYVMPPSQREHIIDNPEEKCKPNELVGMKMDIHMKGPGSLTPKWLNTWGAKIVRNDDSNDITIDTTIYCS